MRCSDARRRFTPLLDRLLPPAEKAALDEHVAGCDRCGPELARWVAAAATLRARGPTPPPPGLAERAHRAAMAAEPPLPLAGAFVRAGRAAVLAGAAAAVAVWLGVLATGAGPRVPPELGGELALAAQDPMELALELQLFAPEGDEDAP